MTTGSLQMSHPGSLPRLTAILILVGLSGCGGGGGGGGSTPPPPSPPPPLTLSPAAAAVFTNETVTLTTAGGTPPYTYSVSAGAGTVSTTGVYSAPADVGTATVTVRDSAGVVATVNVSISLRLAIVPASITMPASSGQSFTFAGQGGTGPYQFQLMSGPGSVTANGVYSAGTGSGTATLQVTDQQGTTATATVKSVFVRTNGPVHSVVSDGTNWYLGGSFSAVNAYQTPGFVALDPADGSPKLGCDLQDGFDDEVLTTVSDGTSLYVGGKFSHYRGVATPGGLVKIDPVNCRVIRTFFEPTDNAILTSALFVSGSSLLVNAYSPRYRGNAIATSVGHVLIRVDTTSGNLDPAFHVTLPIGELPRIYATATAVYAGIYKLDGVTGAWVQGYQIPFNSTVNAYLVAGDSLYIAGFFGGGEGSLRKVDADTGAIDPAFDPLRLTDGYVYDLALVGNSLYVGGAFSKYGTDDRGGLAKVDALTGVLDTTFAPSASFLRAIADGGVHSILYDNGSLYVTGNFVIAGGTPATHIARLDAATGAIDTTFTQAVGLSDTGRTLTKVGTTLYVGGKFVAYRGTPAANLAKLNVTSGVADPAFTNIGTDGRVSALALRDGDLYLGGEFLHYDGAPAQYLAKVSASSAALDTTFTQSSVGPNQPISTLSAGASGLFIGHEFRVYRGVYQPGFSKVSYTDGSLVQPFSSGIDVDSFAPIVVHEPFAYAATSYGVMSRVDTTSGVRDTSFPGVPAAGAQRIAITFAGDTGYASFLRFDAGGGNPVSAIGKFDASTGTVDTNFIASFDSVFHPIHAMRSVGSSLYVAASSEQFAPTDGYGLFLARLDATTGAMDTAFSQPSKSTNAPIRAIESTGADVWVAGEFTRYRGAPANYFVRIDPVTGAISEP